MHAVQKIGIKGGDIIIQGIWIIKGFGVKGAQPLLLVHGVTRKCTDRFAEKGSSDGCMLQVIHHVVGEP